MDTLTPSQRHDNMAAIRSKDTKPELLVRQWLWRHGFRYSLNKKGLPGHPDLVLRKYRTCVFVNGCFWHGHGVTESPVHGDGFMVQGSSCCRIPATNREFWERKIRRNKDRDGEVKTHLEAMDWRCLTVWECELRPKAREATLETLAARIKEGEYQTECRMYNFPDEEENLPMVADEG